MIDTWRPIVPNTEMKRYFIGGTPELEDLSYCGGSNALLNDSNVLSRYGFRTQTSGRILTKMHIMHQSKALLPSTSETSGLNRKSSKWNRYFILTTVMTILV